jgi:CBS domain-containing protein
MAGRGLEEGIMILIKDWMSKKIATVTESQTILDAVKLMDKQNIGSVVVVQGKKPVGILTERDMLRKVMAKGKEPKTILIKEVMTPNPKMLSEDATLLDVTKLMNKYGFRHIIIINAAGDLSGMVTAKDLIKLVSV